MPLIPRYETDEHGCLLCPLCEPWPDRDGCSIRGLHVVWEMAAPLERDMDSIERQDAAEYAVTTNWRVECIDGHVLARSKNENGVGDDAEPFWIDALPVMHLGTEVAPALGDPVA